ncbi:hypothetical protein AYI69_g4577 [Smittium culicis]|uniref:Uncharacterized protein n=1 Tax=Smittium culicis TaxID=133412 RepID=A0A1R1YCE0_9FUNG|nr:hypothetical protein AYI69_g4577 [Smittium culicis]
MLPNKAAALSYNNLILKSILLRNFLNSYPKYIQRNISPHVNFKNYSLAALDKDAFPQQLLDRNISKNKPNTRSSIAYTLSQFNRNLNYNKYSEKFVSALSSGKIEHAFLAFFKVCGNNVPTFLNVPFYRKSKNSDLKPVVEFFQSVCLLKNSNTNQIFKEIIDLSVNCNHSQHTLSELEMSERLYLAVKFIDAIYSYKSLLLKSKINESELISSVQKVIMSVVPLNISSDVIKSNTLAQSLQLSEKKFGMDLSFYQYRLLILGSLKAKSYLLPSTFYTLAKSKADPLNKKFYPVASSMLQYFAANDPTHISANFNIDSILSDIKNCSSSLKNNDYYWLMSYYGKNNNIEKVLELYNENLLFSSYKVSEAHCKSLFNAIGLAYLGKNEPHWSGKMHSPNEKSKSTHISKFCVDQFKLLINSSNNVSSYTFLFLIRALSRMNQQQQLTALLKFSISEFLSFSTYPITEFLNMIVKNRLGLSQELGGVYDDFMEEISFKDGFSYYHFKSYFDKYSYPHNSNSFLTDFNELNRIIRTPASATLHLKKLFSFYSNDIENNFTIDQLESQIKLTLSIFINNTRNIYNYRVLSILLANISTIKKFNNTDSSLLSFIITTADLCDIDSFISVLLSKNIYVNSKLINSYMKSHISMNLVDSEKLRIWYFIFWRKQFLRIEKNSLFLPDEYSISTIFDACSNLGYYDLGLEIADDFFSLSKSSYSQNPEKTSISITPGLFYAYFRLLVSTEMNYSYGQSTIPDKESIFSSKSTFCFAQRVIDMFDTMEIFSLNLSPHFVCHIIETSEKLENRHILEYCLEKLEIMENNGYTPNNYLKKFFSRKNLGLVA